MKKKFLLIFVFLFCFGLVLSGCGQQPETVLVDSISISKKNLYLAEGQTAQITAQVYPFNADNQNFELVSSNPSVVTIDNGFVQAIKAGNATISAISQDGGYKDTCNVLVTTVKNNLALNNYNNMNMPMNISNQKQTEENNSNIKKLNKNNKKMAKNDGFLSKNEHKTVNSQNFVKVNDIKETQNADKKTTAKQLLNDIKNRTMQELSQGYDAGKNIFDQMKQEFDLTVQNFKNDGEQTKNSLLEQAETEKENTIKSFFDLQTEIFDSMQNIQKQIDQDIKNMKTNIVNQIETIEQNLDGDEYVVETKDINGVKFVVITNKTN